MRQFGLLALIGALLLAVLAPAGLAQSNTTQTIRYGTVTGWGFSGIDLGHLSTTTSTLIEGVTASQNGVSGIECQRPHDRARMGRS